MDPATAMLAGTVVNILAPYVQQSAEALVKTVGEVGYEKAKALFESLKTRWVGKPAAANLEEFEHDPEGSKEILVAVLKKQLDSDHSLREEVDRRVQEIGPFLTVFQKMQRGEKVVGLDTEELASGTVGVHQEIDQATDVTGARIKRIG